MKSILCLTVLLLLLGTGARAISVDPGIVYSPSQSSVVINAPGIVGIPFRVNSDFYFEDLGVYDHGSDGVKGPITVSIGGWNGDRTNFSWYLGPAVATVTIQNASADQTLGGVSWKALSSPVVLTPGWYVLYAIGFTETDPAINNPNYTLNTFGGALSWGQFDSGQYYQFVGNSWQTGSVPIFVAGGSLSLPEPSTYALIGTVGLALYLLRRRKTAAKK